MYTYNLHILTHTAINIHTNNMIPVIIYPLLVVFTISEFNNQILDVLIPLNCSRPRKSVIEVKYFVDQEKYFYFTTGHICAATVVGATVMVATEATSMIFLQHICGLFKILR